MVRTLEIALLRVGLGPVFLAPKRRFMAGSKRVDFSAQIMSEAQLDE